MLQELGSVIRRCGHGGHTRAMLPGLRIGHAAMDLIGQIHWQKLAQDGRGVWFEDVVDAVLACIFIFILAERLSGDWQKRHNGWHLAHDGAEQRIHYADFIVFPCFIGGADLLGDDFAVVRIRNIVGVQIGHIDRDTMLGEILVHFAANGKDADFVASGLGLFDDAGALLLSHDG